MPPPITAMRSVMPVTRAACPSPPTCGGRGRNLRAAPQALRGDCGAFGHRAQFLERDVGVELAVAGEGAEAAIAAGDDALAADDVGEAGDALGAQLRVPDVFSRGGEDTRHA